MRRSRGTSGRRHDRSHHTGAAVVRLRALDLPLAGIKAILDARDPTVTGRLLAEHRVAIEQRLEETRRILADLDQPLVVPDGLVETRRSGPRHVLALAADVPGAAIERWLDLTHAELAEVAGAHGGVIGPPGAFYPAQLDDEETEHVEAFVEVARPFLVPDWSRARFEAVPETVWAVIGHVGPFADIGGSYRLLGAWVGAHTRTAGPRVAERYLDRRPGHEHTEIWWPIAPG